MISRLSIALLWTEPYPPLFSYLLTPPVYDLRCFATISSITQYCQTIPPHIMVVKRTLYIQDDGLKWAVNIRNQPLLHMIPIILGSIDPPGHPYEESSSIIYELGINGCFGIVYNIEGIEKMIHLLVNDPTRIGLSDQ